MPIFPVLPPLQDWTFKPVFDLRERFERRIDRDFDQSASDNRSDLFSRWRAGVDFKYKSEFSGRVQYQYAHNLFWTPAQNGSLERSDLFLGYLDFGMADGRARLGRQQLIIGSQRLMGESDWGNTSRSFDAARWTGKKLDLFAGRLAVNSSPSKDAVIAGAFYQGSLGDSMLIYKHDERLAGHDDVYTLNHNYKFKSGKLSGDVEGAYQLGRRNDQKLQAWAAGSKWSYQADSKWRVYGELGLASGGGDADTIRTFDQIYASNHSRYGIMDMQGWRNMTGFTLGANFKPNSKLSLSFEFHKFGLWDSEDAWYGDGGSRNGSFVDPSGNSGRDVGQEFNLYGSYAIDGKSQLEAGVGLFQPGEFIKSFPGKRDQQLWGYLQYRIRF